MREVNVCYLYLLEMAEGCIPQQSCTKEVFGIIDTRRIAKKLGGNHCLCSCLFQYTLTLFS